MPAPGMDRRTLIKLVIWAVLLDLAVFALGALTWRWIVA